MLEKNVFALDAMRGQSIKCLNKWFFKNPGRKLEYPSRHERNMTPAREPNFMVKKQTC